MCLHSLETMNQFDVLSATENKNNQQQCLFYIPKFVTASEAHLLMHYVDKMHATKWREVKGVVDNQKRMRRLQMFGGTPPMPSYKSDDINDSNDDDNENERKHQIDLKSKSRNKKKMKMIPETIPTWLQTLLNKIEECINSTNFNGTNNEDKDYRRNGDDTTSVFDCITKSGLNHVLVNEYDIYDGIEQHRKYHI